MSELPERIGDYEIESQLGAGGMATVYKARHTILDTHHAIKVLSAEYRANADARQRFLDEAKLQAKHLDHPNIVKVTNVVATTEHAALVMELVEGPSLEAMLGELKTNAVECKRIMLGVLDAVGAAHAAGVIHRDLKPANVLLAKVGGLLIPKVTDFGIAKITDAGGKSAKKSTHADARMGTLHYMSPEQVRRSKDVTPRSDIFSLGAMLFEMAAGEVPFGGDSDYDMMENIVNGRYSLPADVDPVIGAVITKALDADPAKRFASCAEMATALRGTELGVEPAPAPAPHRPAAAAAAPEPTPVALPRRSRVPLYAAGLLLIGGAALGLVLFLRSRSTSAAGFTTAEQVMEASLVAQGGRALIARRSTEKIVATEKLEGASGSETAAVTVFESVPDRVLRTRVYTIENSPYTMAYGLRDGFGWRLDFGHPTVIVGKARAEALREDFLNVELHWKELYPDAKLQGRVTFGGQPAYKILLTTDTTAKTRYFATDSLLPIGETRTEEDGVTTETTYSDMRKISGVSYPFKIIIKTGATTAVIDVTSVEINGPIPPETYDIPAEVRGIKQQRDPDLAYAIAIDGYPVEGPEDAKVTLVVASDHACSFCKQARPMLAAMQEKFGSDLRIVHRPFLAHPQARAAAAATCAAARQGRFTQLDNLIWDQSTEAMKFDPANCLEARACPITMGQVDEAGIDRDKFRVDIDACNALVDQSQRELAAFGVVGVPEIFINGRSFVGNKPDVLAAAISRELKVVNARIESGASRKTYYREWVIERGEKMVPTIVVPPNVKPDPPPPPSP